ncbi:potassium-transporting ATPase subunit KdpC [Reyranella sp. CPCC 100927]|uniref:potassium-transporting ATPase subunit KdpC n=1 Tax=Reyranella sp. CPCC 100927 TaxID=2599616 RepID=UPI0011B52AE5|nr:potassium-transporting ATPase subunit KdpC [Reyranella sp. CPCC 100927]TWT15365.1 potassium-transporting ATPase subunit KdpC [Reyranella sp. CPCC 100927]
MLRDIRPALVMMILMTVLLGLVYPLGMTGIAGAILPQQAAGSLQERDGKVIGSSLIGQNFTSDKYFQGRLSATTDTDPNDATKTVPSPYNAASSLASNLGPTSKALVERVQEDVAKRGGSKDKPLPADMVTTSGSGLDPHISPANAALQVARVAKARGMPEERVRALVAAATEDRQFGVLGEVRINVLQLNLALDAAK